MKELCRSEQEISDSVDDLGRGALIQERRWKSGS